MCCNIFCFNQNIPSDNACAVSSSFSMLHLASSKIHSFGEGNVSTFLVYYPFLHSHPQYRHPQTRHSSPILWKYGLKGRPTFWYIFYGQKQWYPTCRHFLRLFPSISIKHTKSLVFLHVFRKLKSVQKLSLWKPQNHRYAYHTLFLHCVKCMFYIKKVRSFHFFGKKVIDWVEFVSYTFALSARYADRWAKCSLDLNKIINNLYDLITYFIKTKTIIWRSNLQLKILKRWGELCVVVILIQCITHYTV